MASTLKRSTLFVALARPQMVAGVTYSYFVFNAVIAAELFLLFKTFWAIAVALVVHLIGMLACLREPRFFDIWIAQVSRCPRIRNYRLWGCNSYRP